MAVKLLDIARNKSRKGKIDGKDVVDIIESTRRELEERDERIEKSDPASSVRRVNRRM